MTEIARWTATCQQRQRGRLFLDNLALDIDSAHLDPTSVLRFRQALEDSLSQPISPPSPSEGDLFTYFGTTAISGSTLYLQGSRIIIPEEDLAFVFRLDNFIADLWYDFTDAGGYDQLSGPESILKLLGGIGDLSSIIRKSAAMRGGLPMVWLTSLSDLQAEINDQHLRADAARNALGLLHYATDCYLCYIRVAPGDLNWTNLRRPSAFDGGLSLVFRSNQTTEPTGRAIDLVNCRPRLPEVVTPPVAIRSHHKPLPLGRLSSSPGFSWDVLCSSVVETRIARIAQTLS